MTTISIPAADAVTIASLIHLTDPKTPGLDTIHLSSTGVETLAIATDRYLMGQFFSTATAPGMNYDGPEWQLTAAACKFITANVKPLNKWHDPAPVVVDLDTDARQFTITAGAATFTDTWPVSPYKTTRATAFLSVMNRWEKATDAQPVTLTTRLLIKLSKLMDGFTKADKWTLELGAGQSELHPTRPGPVRATKGGLSVIIQPNFLVN